MARLEAPTPTPLGRHPLGHVWPHAQTQSRARSGVQRSRRAAIKHAGTSSRLTLRLAVSVQSATAAATILALRKVCFCLILGQIDRLYQKHSASMQRKGADLCMSSIYADGVLASAVFICFFWRVQRVKLRLFRAPCSFPSSEWTSNIATVNMHGKMLAVRRTVVSM